MKRARRAGPTATPQNDIDAILPTKITQPRLGQCYLRKRLFHQLDQFRDMPAVWISGPAGSGKTMLAASYLQERKFNALWYQIDARDEDPANLFYYLGMAAKPYIPPRRKALPLLTPEYLGGLPAFVCNFFTTLFQWLKPPFTLVLDNYQSLTEEALLHDVVRDIIALVPPGGQVVLISRSQPPPVLSRIQANQQMALLGWKELRLSAAEVQDLSSVVQKAPLAKSEATALQAATLGWAAGVVLMIAQPQSDTNPIDAAALSAPEAVFDYFAAEIFSQLDLATREIMVNSAFLPQVSAAMATALTGHEQTGRILADLAQKNYFTLQCNDRSPRLYQYHPLFKSFLMQQAQHLLSADQLKDLQHRAAELLIKARQYDDAAELLKSAHGWDQLIEMIYHQAQDLVAQGRLGTLKGWLQALPQEMYAQQPWLPYWLGICRLFFAPDQSQLHFEHSFAGFKANNDVEGIYLSLSGIIKAITYQHCNYHRLDLWFEELEILKDRFGKIPSKEIEAQLLTSVLSYFYVRTIQFKAFNAWAQQADALWRHLTDMNLRLELGCSVLAFHCMIGNRSHSERISNELNRLATSEDVSPAIIILVFLQNAFASFHWGRNHKALKYSQKALTIANASGIHILDCTILATSSYAALSMGDIEKADTYLEKIKDRLGRQSQNMETAHYYFLSGWRDAISGNLNKAVEQLKNACKITHGVGAIVPDFHCHQGLALTLFALNKRDQAQSMLEKASSIAARLDLPWIAYLDLQVRAYFDLKCRHRKAGLACLSQALYIASKHQYSQTLFWQSDVMAYLYGQALENNIEVDYVRRLIRKFNIMPPTASFENTHWPWSIRILTLGRFEVQSNDKVLAPRRRGQSKPLDLLKAIIAYGGRQVSEEQLWDALWPDAEGDAAHVAFTTTLYRLRKLIGHEQAIILQGRRISLDPRHCWVDAWCLQDMLSPINTKDHAIGQGDIPPSQLAERVFNLYRGHFLADDESPWLLGTRERLRILVLRKINTLGAHCQALNQWHPAITIYERGLLLDSLMESFYIGLMKCYQQMERRSDALAIYERCRMILEQTLGVSPCADIEFLRQQLLR